MHKRLINLYRSNPTIVKCNIVKGFHSPFLLLLYLIGDATLQTYVTVELPDNRLITGNAISTINNFYESIISFYHTYIM